MYPSRNMIFILLTFGFLPLVCSGDNSYVPADGLSIDLKKCQYSKAIGDSERLDAQTYSLLKNSCFQDSGDSWKCKNVNFFAKKAFLQTGSQLRNSCFVEKLLKNTRYEAYIELEGSGSIEICLETLNDSKQPTRPIKRNTFVLTGKRQILKYQILAFPETTELALSIKQISGKSTIYHADIRSTDSMKWVSVRCMPAAITDNMFCVLEKNPIPMSFQYRTSRPGKQHIPEFIDLVLKYPEGFYLKPGLALNLISETVENGIKTTRYRSKTNSIPTQYFIHKAWGVLIGTNLKASDKVYTFSYHLEYSGVKTEPYLMNIKVLSEISAKSPRLFRTGFQSNSDNYFRKGAGAEDLADTIRNFGFNFIHHDTHVNSKAFSNALRNNGLLTTVTDYYFLNGYILGFGIASMSENVKFIGIDGKPVKFNTWHCYLCPVAAYTQSEFFKNNFLEYLSDKVNKNNFSSFFLPNWEPFPFDDKGCFCDRCKEEFIKYSKISRENVDKAWPKEMLGEYRNTWVKFRSWQHSKVIDAILNGMRELSKKYNKEFVFCPSVSIGDLLETSKFYDQYTVRDYIDKLDWLNPWGPYIFHNASTSYKYNVGNSYGVYVTSQIVKDKVKGLRQDKKNLRLLALPHAYQCTTWVTEPEAMAYETAAYFIHGWDASQLYFFSGLDGRYWKTMGELNNAISHVEEFVFKGEKKQDVSLKQISPCPRPMAVYDANNPTLARFADQMRKGSLVTLDSFVLQGRVLLAIGNAWQRGDAFVKVSIPGLQNGIKYAVTIPDKKITLEKNYTSQELADGILLHVGALRFCFYIVEPVEASKNYGTVVGRNALMQLLKARLPEIQKRYLEDQAYAAEFIQTPTYDFSQMPSLKVADIEVAPKSNLNDSLLRVKTKSYSCDLDMGHGGVVTNYVKNGRTLIDSKSAIFRDGFINPLLLLDVPYEFVSWDATKDGAEVVLRYKVLTKDSKSLKGLNISKNYMFTEQAIVLKTVLKNESNHPMTFSYRVHNIPTLFTRNGNAKLSDDVLITRTSEAIFHPVSGFTGTCFGAKIGRPCSGSTMTFTEKDCMLKLFWNMPDFIGIYRWDAPKSPISTVELATSNITLQPGQEIKLTLSLK